MCIRDSRITVPKSSQRAARPGSNQGLDYSEELTFLPRLIPVTSRTGNGTFIGPFPGLPPSPLSGLQPIPQELRQHIPIQELERDRSGAVVTAAQAVSYT